MARFVVQRLHNAQRLGRLIEIEAQNEQIAAESVIGEPLVDGEQAGRLAAEVYHSDMPTAKRLFSRPSQRQREA